MKVKLCLLFTIVIILLGAIVIYFGYQMVNSTNNSTNKRDNKDTNDAQVRLPEPKLDQFSPYYTAAVAEIEVLSDGDDETPSYINQMVDIINSPEVKEADIVVLSEAILNRDFINVFIPNSTVFCDDPDAHFTFRNISCAARNAKKYVVLNMYTKVKCSEDDQPFCMDTDGGTNIYNMMHVFDRHGKKIVTYRKYNPYNENVAVTVEPEIVTFRTDFNVTFGVMVCFDLMLNIPGNVLVQRGIRNFVFSTMWHNQLPYGVSVQYQQSWAYAHNVNLIAANANWQIVNTTGSGIYAGRLGAQKIFISEIPTSKVLVARLPINLPSENDIPTVKADEDIKVFPNKDDRVIEDEDFKPFYDERLIQEKMHLLTVEFLDFSLKTNFSGTVCQGDFCCNYDIQISKNSLSQNNAAKFKPSYSYAISVFNAFYQFGEPKFMRTKQLICSVIACTELDDEDSCSKRFAEDVQLPYSFDKLKLKAVLQMDRESNILPSTLTHDLYPLNVAAFEFKKSKLHNEERYATSLNLKIPKSDLLTFGIIGRDYKKDTNALDELQLLADDLLGTPTDNGETQE